MSRLRTIGLIGGLTLACTMAASADSVTFRGTVPFDTTRTRVATGAPVPLDTKSSIARIGQDDGPRMLTIVSGEPPVDTGAIARDALRREIEANPLLLETLADAGVVPGDVVALTIGAGGVVTIWVDADR